jgi:hypothetical protein
MLLAVTAALIRYASALLEREKFDLVEELRNLPQNAVVRRINDLVKRARSVKVWYRTACTPPRPPPP